MRRGDASRRRRFGPGSNYYAEFRTYRLSRRQFGQPLMTFEAFLQRFRRKPST